MAHSIVYLKHPELPIITEAPVGFSWTCLFLGFLLFAYRQDWWLCVVCMVITFAMGPLPNIVLCWSYNQWYLNRKLRAGYQVLQVDNLS